MQQLTGKVSRPHIRMGLGTGVWLKVDEDKLIKGVRIPGGISDKIWVILPILKIKRGGFCER